MQCMQVLGLPLNATINPLKQCVDYCEVHDDLLSVEAFQVFCHSFHIFAHVYKAA